MRFKIKEIQAKSIIGTTKVPSADYVINPYTGCQFGCMYCFASFMGRFVGEKNEDWGKGTIEFSSDIGTALFPYPKIF